LRRTKIIATLGPACDDEETIQQLLSEFILSEGGGMGGAKDLWWCRDDRCSIGDPSLRSG